ncbi:MAG: tetratricopeptide repeat protein, partial [Proteobacteria bacterium]|nr:tetratricopeptide repeat protein [Pseudomonadota bacterium]
VTRGLARVARLSVVALVACGASPPAPPSPARIGGEHAPHLDLHARADAALVAGRLDDARAAADAILANDPSNEHAQVVRARIAVRTSGGEIGGAEASSAPLTVTLPPIPAFDVSGVTPEGTHGVRSLRLAGAPLLGNELSVTGVITMVYDCPVLDTDPTRCERKKFYLGDTATTPVERSVWIVDVPRPFSKLERRVLARDDLANPGPDRCVPSRSPGCPVLRVGDRVTVTGQFMQVSPHAERDDAGLVVYAAMTNHSAKWTSTDFALHPATSMVMPALASTVPISATIAPRVNPASSVSLADLEAARRDLSAANRAFQNQQLEEAINTYRAALARWPDLPLASYGLGSALAAAGRWGEAFEAFATAVALSPGQAMFQQGLGIAAAESRQLARARVQLAEALRLDGRLWLAHFYLGRIARDTNEPVLAATELSAAISTNPRVAGPILALAELYRGWDYLEAALAVTELGLTTVPGLHEASTIWLANGLAHADRREDASAIAAFGKALEADPGNLRARFHRGQIAFRQKELGKAKADLEAFVRAAPVGADFLVGQADAMLLDLATRR